MIRAKGRFSKELVGSVVFKEITDQQEVTVGRKITGVGRLLQRCGIIRAYRLKRLRCLAVLYTNN